MGEGIGRVGGKGKIRLGRGDPAGSLSSLEDLLCRIICLLQASQVDSSRMFSMEVASLSSILQQKILYQSVGLLDDC